jgi:LysM repeat protein
MMRAWRAIGLMGWLFFLCSLAYISLSGRPNRARAITVNGQIAVWVKDERAAERVLSAVLQSKRGRQFNATVAHDTFPLPEGAQVLSERQAREQLAQQLEVLVIGWKIVLQGEDVVTMDTKEHAEKVLEELKARWRTPKEGERILSQELKPVPALRQTTVPPDELHSDVRAAAEMLQSSQPETVPYTVAAGDTLYSIADKFDVPLSDLIAQNPQVRGRETNIHPGEKLTVKKRRRGVTVITVKQYDEEREEQLPPLIRKTPDLPEGEERLDRPGKPQRKIVTVTVTLH